MPVVPPGHRVVVIHPSPDPFFVASKSGPMMLNFGSVEHVPSALTKIAEWTGQVKDQQSVLWLMPANILPALKTCQSESEWSLRSTSNAALHQYKVGVRSRFHDPHRPKTER